MQLPQSLTHIPLTCKTCANTRSWSNDCKSYPRFVISSFLPNTLYSVKVSWPGYFRALSPQINLKSYRVGNCFNE